MYIKILMCVQFVGLHCNNLDIFLCMYKEFTKIHNLYSNYDHMKLLFPVSQSTRKTTWERNICRELIIKDGNDKTAIRHQAQYWEMSEIPGQICKLWKYTTCNSTQFNGTWQFDASSYVICCAMNKEGSYLPTTCRYIRVVKVQLHSFLTFALHGGQLHHWWLYSWERTRLSTE